MPALMPKIFKSNKRYTDDARPKIGERCLFSPVKRLIPDVFVRVNRSFLHDHISNGSPCRVIRNAGHLVEVLFDDATETDLVSPEFLTNCELTAFGEAFFTNNDAKLTAQTRKLFLGG